MILLTTSRRPYHETRILARELSRVLPSSRYLPRGTKTVNELLSLAFRFGLKGVWIVENSDGKPGFLRCILPTRGSLWEELQIDFSDFVLQRGTGKKIEISPTHLKILPGGEPLAHEISKFLQLQIAEKSGEPAVLVGEREIAFWDGQGRIPPELYVSSWRKVGGEA
ncbi:MAG: hypothetical protein QXX33_02295 [Candidatus Hadarchaeales archaeon]